MTPPWPRAAPSPAERAAYGDASPRSYWLDSLPERDEHPPLQGAVDADLLIVGGGYTGLWAALHAVGDDAGRDVVVVEAERCGSGASGRNGGFVSSSLTHGLANGLSRFGPEAVILERLGLENFDGLRADLERLSIDADYEANGDLEVSLEHHELQSLHHDAEILRRFGHDVDVLDAGQIRAQVDSPTYLGGLWVHSGAALVHPGKLADGLRDAAARAGTRIHERTRALGITRAGDHVEVVTDGGVVRARRVLLATSAYPPLLRALRHFVVPVYDYALITEPLGARRREAIGWRERQGISDGANQFHYYRLTADDRVLWGGFDAVYRYGGPVGPHLDDHDATFARLAQHFFATFPQLEGVRFTHRWGGAIDTCSRFSVFFGTAFGGHVAYATGYTGLGVGASRFGARVALDLLDGRDTEATGLDYVRTRPVPFPPEPLRTAVIQLTRNRLAAADRREGRRGVWLRTLDRLGLGFQS
ncbi:MAG: FAD-binding oxidoreductase [Solirubrobacteraceae bacterium]